MAPGWEGEARRLLHPPEAAKHDAAPGGQTRLQNLEDRDSSADSD